MKFKDEASTVRELAENIDASENVKIYGRFCLQAA